MALTTHNESNGTQETVSLSVKGIPTPVSQALKDVSDARKINQSVLLRELVNMPMGSFIHVFCQKSPLVTSLDLEVAKYIGGTSLPVWQTAPLNHFVDASYRELLGIHNEGDLTRILMQNAKDLHMRAVQAIPYGTQFLGGMSMYLALFCEVARRDEITIEAFWTNIVRYWGAWYQRQDFYQHINQLRSVNGLPAANALTASGAQGVYTRVEIFQAENGQEGLSHVLMTLRTENTRSLPASVFERFALPYCNGNMLAPDPGYGVPYIHPNNALGMGFRFKEEICSLHCYSVTDARIGPTQTLSEVAIALVSAVDEPLKPYSSTFTVNK